MIRLPEAVAYEERHVFLLQDLVAHNAFADSV
jgi:hypothetical protein